MKILKGASTEEPRPNANLPEVTSMKIEAPVLKAEVSENGTVVLQASPGALQEATGTSDTALAMRMLDQASAGINAAKTRQEATTALNAIIASLNGIQPKDHVEGMLAVQITTSYNMAMKFLAATTGPQSDLDKNLNRSLKLMAACQRAIDTLKRYRGKGAQRIVVEHFNMVNGGDAAIIIGSQGEKPLSSTAKSMKAA